MKFLHVGIPTTEIKGDEDYLENLKVHYTSPDNHPYSIEYFRYSSISELPEILKNQPHIAYEVESLEDAMKDIDEVVVKPFFLGDSVVTFAIKDNLILELVQV